MRRHPRATHSYRGRFISGGVILPKPLLSLATPAVESRSSTARLCSLHGNSRPLIWLLTFLLFVVISSHFPYFCLFSSSIHSVHEDILTSIALQPFRSGSAFQFLIVGLDSRSRSTLVNPHTHTRRDWENYHPSASPTCVPEHQSSPPNTPRFHSIPFAFSA